MISNVSSNDPLIVFRLNRALNASSFPEKLRRGKGCLHRLWGVVTGGVVTWPVAHIAQSCCIDAGVAIGGLLRGARSSNVEGVGVVT